MICPRQGRPGLIAHRVSKSLKAKAAMAKKAGDKARAEVSLNAPIDAPTIVAPPSVPKTQTVISLQWGYRIDDKDAIPREYLMPNDKKLEQVARATKGTLKIPGVTFLSQP